MVSENRPPEWLSWVVITANLIAFADLPYGYFQLLRLVVTGYCVWVAYKRFSEENLALAWVFVLVAILYNPIFKIYMARETHQIVNILTAAIAFVELVIWKRSRGLR